MGERTILVCDVCGRPAVQSITIKVGRQNWTKDLCQIHVDELTAGARRPRPGRRRAVVATEAAAPPRRRGRPPKSASAGGATGTRRRGRPPKSQTAAGAKSGGAASAS